jgi:hypothetical protein
VALTSFRRATMSRAQQRLPVLSVLPVAYWVDGDTGLKQTTEQNWANKYLDARELAVIVPIPQAVLDDVDFDIWGEVRPRLVEAFGVKIDAAALFGTDSPSGWPDSIVEAAVAAGNVVEVGESTGDIAADVNLVMGNVEEDGFDDAVRPTGRPVGAEDGRRVDLDPEGFHQPGADLAPDVEVDVVEDGLGDGHDDRQLPGIEVLVGPVLLGRLLQARVAVHPVGDGQDREDGQALLSAGHRGAAEAGQRHRGGGQALDDGAADVLGDEGADVAAVDE